MIVDTVVTFITLSAIAGVGYFIISLINKNGAIDRLAEKVF